MRRLVPVVFALLWPSLSLAADADPASQDLSTALATARLGKTKLRVETKTGVQFEGNYHGVTDAGLNLHRVHGFKVDPFMISADSVAMVWERHDRAGRGALIGLIAGGAIGAAIPPDDNGWVSEGAARVLTGLSLGLISSGVGYLIGRQVRRWQPIYTRP